MFLIVFDTICLKKWFIHSGACLGKIEITNQAQTVLIQLSSIVIEKEQS